MSVEIPLSRGLVAIVDEGDCEALSQFKWSAASMGGRTFYAVRNTRRPEGGWVVQSMHRVLTGWARVDHANGNGLDNRRLNLRPASQQQNTWNLRKRRGTTSRFKGVCWSTRDGIWLAYIKLHGHDVWLGQFRDEERAARTYDAAARELFGEFAAPNFPLAGERGALS